MKGKSFKALLLAAGLGTRLGNITTKVPKCLVKVQGKTMLDYWLDKLEAAGCEEVLVNTHYKAEMVENHISHRKKCNMKVTTKFENQLLGTGGTLLANKS